MAGLLTTTVVAAVAPLLVYLWPSNARIKKGQLPVTLSNPLDQIGDGEAVKFDAPSSAGFIMADGGGDNYPGKVAFGGFLVKNASATTVFAVTCSHLGCSVNFDSAKKQFMCPCHGSIFAINGEVVHGPAQASLSHLTWTQGDQPNQILVEGYTGIT